jgi:SAM-dependent methyltransferase
VSDVFDAYAAFYDLLYQHKDYAGEAAFVAKLLAREGLDKGSVLDLGCGTGIHAQQLQELGFQVAGVDLSPEMVERARVRAAEYGLDSSQFVVGDVRTVRAGRMFNAVVSLFHVASYQTTNTDIAAMFETAAAHLESGGLFVFDFWHSPGVLTDLPETRIKRLEGKDLKFTRLAEPEVDFARNIVTINYTILPEANDTHQPEIREQHRMRHFSLPELDILLRNAGFSLKAQCPWMFLDRNLQRDWLGCVIAARQ